MSNCNRLPSLKWISLRLRSSFGAQRTKNKLQSGPQESKTLHVPIALSYVWWYGSILGAPCPSLCVKITMPYHASPWGHMERQGAKKQITPNTENRAGINQDMNDIDSVSVKAGAWLEVAWWAACRESRKSSQRAESIETSADQPIKLSWVWLLQPDTMLNLANSTQCLFLELMARSFNIIHRPCSEQLNEKVSTPGWLAN